MSENAWKPLAMLSLAVLVTALVFTAFWMRHSKPAYTPVPYHVAHLTVDLERARLRADMLEVVAREKWVTNKQGVSHCLLCDSKWTKVEKHKPGCVLNVPEWRKR